jgi:putative flippase GtrA
VEAAIQHADKIYRHSLTRYLVVGGTTFALDFFILITGHELFGLSVILAATFSYWLSLAYNFAINRFWTFGARKNIKKHAVAYTLLVIFNYLASLLIIWSLGLIGVQYYIAKIVAVGLAMAWNYLAYKNLVFT